MRSPLHLKRKVSSLSNSVSNFPNAQGLSELEKPDIRCLVSDLRQLHNLGQPKTDAEVEQRITDYFAFCENSALRPGIESLCLALHISRMSLFNWANGRGCSAERQRIVQTAKAFISAFLEQITMSGKISPPSGIFLLKNWCNYKDAYSFDAAGPTDNLRPTLTTEEIEDQYADFAELPEKPNFDD